LAEKVGSIKLQDGRYNQPGKKGPAIGLRQMKHLPIIIYKFL